MKAWHLVVLILVGGGYLLLRPPSGEKIARDMRVDLRAGQVVNDSVVYTAEWGESQTREGAIRHITRAHDRNVPIVTFHLVLTTGEFSDPDLVKLEHLGGGSYIWRAERQPEGTLKALHAVPESETVFRTLRRFEAGDQVEITGRDEQRGVIENDQGGSLRLGHSNHAFVLVSRAKVKGGR